MLETTQNLIAVDNCGRIEHLNDAQPKCTNVTHLQLPLEQHTK